MLSWKKSHFMVREGVVLGHIVSGKCLEVDKGKIEVIQNLPLPTTVKDLWSFLGHVGFFLKFIQDFAKVSKPFTTLLCKDKDFIIDEEGKRSFTMIKQALIEASILQSPNWDLPSRSCATLRSMRWEQSWGNELTRSRRPSDMQVRPSSKLKLIIRLRRKSFWRWSTLSRSSGHTTTEEDHNLY